MVWGENVAHVSTLYNINLVATGLSLVASLLMIYACLRSGKIRIVSFKLLLAIVLSDLGFSLSNLLSAFETQSNGVLCHIEAFLRQFTYLLSMYFVTVTSILCYKCTTHPNFDQNRFFLRVVAFGCLSCLFMTCLPFFTDYISYENGDLFCWVAYPKNAEMTTKTKIFVVLLLEGFPAMLGITITFIGYVLAIKETRNLRKSFLIEIDVNVYKLLWYPLVMFLTFVPGVIDNLVKISLNSQVSYAFETTHLILTHSIGFSNALVYGLQRNWGTETVYSQDKSVKSEDSQRSMYEDLRNA